MQIIRHLSSHASPPTAIAIGNFDGLHLGHRAVIDSMVRAAQAHRAVPGVLTFEPHPRRFFQPETANFRIASLHDKFSLLRDAGVHNLFVPRFDTGMATLSAEEFLGHVLQRQLNAKVVVTGENFVFGHQRGGTTELLKAWGRENGVEIITVPPVAVEGKICSSSAVRKMLAAGEVAQAASLLGRPYRLSGRVVHGQGRGAGIGFPTANVALPAGVMLPAYGVYAVRAELDGTMLDGVANLGIRPTMGSYAQPVLEVHLFEIRRVIYEKELKVSLLHFLRPERKFGSVEELTQQIARDSEHAKTLLRDHHA